MERGPYRNAVSLEGWQQRFREVLTSRFGLRLHMSLIMMLVMGTGVLVARLLKPVVSSMGIRYGFAVALAYAAFFGFVRVWLHYASERLLTEAPREAVPAEARAIVGQMGEPVREPSGFRDDAGVYQAQAAVDVMHMAAMSPSSGGHRTRNYDVPDVSLPSGGESAGSSGGGSGSSVSLDADGEGLAVVVVLAVVALVVLAVFGVAVMSVWQAPAILGEAAFELVLAGTLARAARRVEGRSWSRALWKATWGRALAVMILAMVAGFAAQSVCPGVDTMRAAVRQCVMDSGTAR
jgi:hypothetical protein